MKQLKTIFPKMTEEQEVKRKKFNNFIKGKMYVTPESSWRDVLIVKVAFEIDKNKIHILKAI